MGGMDANPYPGILRVCKAFFDRSTAALEESDSSFAPLPGMYTAAQHVAHVAQTVDWFLHGAFSGEGFDLDFEKHDREVRAVISLDAARAWLDRSVERACARLAEATPAEMAAALPEGPVMGGEPRSAVLAAITDHTAHHRGALTVYTRLCGKTPAMPYGA